MNNVIVSVVVCTYNQEHTVGRTIESILAQKTEYPFEIIIGEDASPSDNTRAVCEAYAEKYPDIIRLMPKVPNKGVVKNYADCLGECRGKYIAGCAGDDWWHNPDKLQIQVEHLISNDDCVMVYTNYDILQVKRRKIIHNALPSISLDTSKIIDKLLLGFFLPPLTIMFCRKMLDYIDFDEYESKGYMAEDLPMFLTFALHGKINCINKSTSTYSAIAGSISQFEDASKMERFILNIRQIKYDFINDHPTESCVTLADVEQLCNRVIFRSAFALFDRKMALDYAKKTDVLSGVDKVKLFVCRVNLLFLMYVKMKIIIIIYR